MGYLVLSRKPNESLRIGENIEIVVLEVKGTRVRLGIDAPRDMRVQREDSAGREQRKAG